MCLLWILLILVMEPIAAKHNYTKQKLVLNGVLMPIEQYPYTAQVVIHNDTLCGGAAITKRVIVTAAHCLYIDDGPDIVSPEEIDVWFGSSNIMSGIHYNVCKSLMHPNSGSPRWEDYYWDIGLLLLTKSIKIGKRVQIAKIAPFNTWRNVKNTMTIAGFGSTDNTDHVTTRLAVTRMQYVDSKICAMSQTGTQIAMPVPNHMFCMIGTTLNSDCKGDSGSAITWRSYIVGLVSLGRDIRDGSCGSDSIASMYTDLTYFRKWVMRNAVQLESMSIERCKGIEENVKTLRHPLYSDCVR